MAFDNCYQLAFDARNTVQHRWGKDQTGTIEYHFNEQGFRGYQSYNWIPDHAFFGNSSVFGIGMPADQILVSYFPQAHNYGLAGTYMNWHSVENLKRFVASPCCQDHTKIVFVWIDRPGEESVPELIDQVNAIRSNVLHISMGERYQLATNLMPSVDLDVSGTHPGPRSHQIWARTIALLLAK